MNIRAQPNLVLKLQDAQGNTYPLLWDETALSMNDGASRTLGSGRGSIWRKDSELPLTWASPSFTAVFAGPVRPDAESLTLTLALAEVVKAGSPAFTLDGGRLITGQPLELQQSLQVGEHEVNVKSITRRADDSAELALAVKGERLPNIVAVLVGGVPMKSSGTSDRGATWMVETPPNVPFTLTTESKIEYLSFRIPGPWEVEIPLP